jgi:multiple sugar transport system ATP-binding protein
MASVTLKVSTVRSGERVAGSVVDLQIQDREFVVLAGPPGCGNSTILRMIAGLLEVPQGDIFLDGRRINDVPPQDRDIAFVSHDYAPYPGMSVYENVAFGLERRKFAKIEIKKRVLGAAEILGLQEQLDRRPQSLSAAERQLIALARAMVHQPKVFLFDEPFSALEPDARRRGRAEIKKLHQRLPATMIYGTHDPVEAIAMGERTVVFNEGIVRQDANAQAIYDGPADLLVARFAGLPPMNLVHGMLKQDRDSLLFSEAGDGTIAIRLPMARFPSAKEFLGQPVVLGIRPEDVEIASSPNGVGHSFTIFRALVDRVEPRGAETDLYLQTGAHELICRSRLWVDQVEGGHRFQFEMNLDKAHLFDPASGRRIMREA